jgi:hypothetical protein
MSDVAKRQTPPPSTLTEPKLTREPREYYHGRSPASWIGSMTALVGGIVGTIGFLAGSVGVIVAGFVIIGVALVATVLLRSMGYGQANAGEGEK